MDRAFVDTSFWLTRIVPNDPWTGTAREAAARLGDVRLVTSEYVLVELLNGLSNRGEFFRSRGVQVGEILANPKIATIEGSPALFHQALQLYGRRGDKRYSLTDCASMIAMRERKIQRVLTSDHHFEQEGFTILMKR